MIPEQTGVRVPANPSGFLEHTTKVLEMMKNQAQERSVECVVVEGEVLNIAHMKSTFEILTLEATSTALDRAACEVDTGHFEPLAGEGGGVVAIAATDVHDRASVRKSIDGEMMNLAIAIDNEVMSIVSGVEPFEEALFPNNVLGGRH